MKQGFIQTSQRFWAITVSRFVRAGWELTHFVVPKTQTISVISLAQPLMLISLRKRAQGQSTLLVYCRGALLIVYQLKTLRNHVTLGIPPLG